jgi:dTDP-D-glucose 4,6-dehydratase
VPYSADDARQFVKNRIGSKKKAAKEIGFEHKIGLEQGLQKLIDWHYPTTFQILALSAFHCFLVRHGAIF